MLCALPGEAGCATTTSSRGKRRQLAMYKPSPARYCTGDLVYRRLTPLDGDKQC